LLVCDISQLQISTDFPHNAICRGFAAWLSNLLHAQGVAHSRAS